MVTIKDVAAKAGVSVSTVSYAISGVRPVSPEKRENIEKTIRELGYRPNEAARNLASRRSHIITVLISPERREIGISELSLIADASQAASDFGYRVVICSRPFATKEDLHGIIRKKSTDGIMLMEVRDNDPRIPVLDAEGIPYLLCGRDVTAEGVEYVDVDFDLTMRRALSYATKLGHRNIAFINQSEAVYRSGYGPVVRMKEAFESNAPAMNARGRSYFCAEDPAEGFALTGKILGEREDTTAILVMNDAILSGVIKAIEKSGRRIPDDISIISLVSSSKTAYLHLPPLTTFEMNGKGLMQQAMRLLVAKMEGHPLEKASALIPCVLVERSSTARNLT